jgi:hypothetical protein
MQDQIRKANRQKRKVRRKLHKAILRKSHSEDVARTLLASINVICGPSNQGQLFYDRAQQIARVVLKPDRDAAQFDYPWKQGVAQALGIHPDRISVGTAAPNDWGTGSTWVCVGPDGQITIDPGLAQVPAELPDSESEDTEVATETPEAAPALAASGSGQVAAHAEMTSEFTKVDSTPDYTYILGPILVPDRVDKQGDMIDAGEIELAAHAYVEDCQRAGVMHKVVLSKRSCPLVESYIVRSPNYVVNGVPISEGTWLAAFRVYDPEVRQAILAGKFRGFSIGADGFASPAV